MIGRRLIVALMMLAVTPALGQTQPVLKGDINAHDPTWVEVDGTQIVFWTGENSTNRGAILAKISPDGITWDDKGTIGESGPAWIADAIGQMPPNIWAPTVFEKDGTHYLYYAASIFGRNTSAIGLLTNDALDPEAPTEGWVDRGPVVVTTTTDDHNAIDAARIDTADGRAWLVFGSYWTGIKMRELDPASGLLLAGTDEIHSLASRNGGPIEAPSILEHDGRFYLFVSFDRCCRGTGSTYRIMVGRAADIKGPYLDKDGVPLLQGGGTEMLKGEGDRRGPGGQETFMIGDEYWLTWHYYDRKMYGLSRLQIARLHFDDAGWPFLDPAPVE
jgi:arabinan endo-1,5-alpha-L-arabinosidase